MWIQTRIIYKISTVPELNVMIIGQPAVTAIIRWRARLALLGGLGKYGNGNDLL